MRPSQAATPTTKQAGLEQADGNSQTLPVWLWTAPVSAVRRANSAAGLWAAARSGAWPGDGRPPRTAHALRPSCSTTTRTRAQLAMWATVLIFDDEDRYNSLIDW